MSVFKLERSVAVGHSCELCFFIKRLCHLHRGVPEASELRWERFETLISFDVGRSRWVGSPWPRGKTLLTSKCVPSPQIVFSYERPGLELQQKGEIATTEIKKVKKGEESAWKPLWFTPLAGWTLPGVSFSYLWGLRGYSTHLFAHTALACLGYTLLSLTFLLAVSYLTISHKWSVIHLAWPAAAPLPLISRPLPGGWKCAQVATTPAVSGEMCRWCMQGGREEAASCLPLLHASPLAL